MLRYRLRKKLHISWLIALVALGIIVGVISAQYIEQGLFSSVSWLLTGTALGLLVGAKRFVYLIPLAILAGFFIGAWRGSLQQDELEVYQYLTGVTTMVQGKVSEDVDTNHRGEQVMRLHNIIIDGHLVTGMIWVTTSERADIKRGDIVTTRGKLQAGFGSFAAALYRSELIKVERPEPGDVARQIRDWFADAVRQAVPEPQASLGIGYLVGQRRGLPPDLEQALQIAGLTHIIVASGYNLTILVRLARRLFEKISKYLAMLSSATMIAIFIAITGLSPSMSRAGLIAGLALAAWYYGRKFHPLVLLPFAAAITLLVNPSYGWNDLGWQLSFSAFAGVMILAPFLQAYFFGNEKPSFIRQILGETISAQIATLPILVLAFGQFSNVAIVANLLVLPLVPLAMLLTFVTGIGALVVPSLAQIIGLPVTGLLTYMTIVAQWLAQLPFAQTELSIEWYHVVCFYTLLILACFYLWQKTKYDLVEANVVE